MAEVELVIKIDEKFLSNIKEFVNNGSVDYEPWVLIAEGKPLPKKHGRLFDERDIVSGNYKIIGNKIYELEPVVDVNKDNA